MKLVTSYTNPDLDGLACMYAYAEYLKREGSYVNYVCFGNPRKEAKFVIDKFSIEINKTEKLIEKPTEIVLVDASDISKALSNEIDLDKVIEIFDHRKVHGADKFPNAKARIELVGACATLIAEQFYYQKIEISKESAILLYSAIVWNTINFKNQVTTDRDITMAKWLKEKAQFPKDYVSEMFASGSEKSFKELFFADFEIMGKKVGIAQLETVGIKEFVKDNFNKIRKLLNDNKPNYDYILLTCIDLERAFNLFVTIDKDSEKLFSRVLRVDFIDNIAQKEGIIMRKEIISLVKEYLEEM
jgi:manganese-dependent inorganic pyrophosphatase